MRKVLASSISVVVIVFVAAVAWFALASHMTQAESDRYADWAKQQKLVPVRFQVTAPAETPKDQTLFISGDASTLGNWDAAGIPMVRGTDGTYTATVQLLSGIQHAYKITRGTWGTVERGAGGVEIADHTFTASADTPVTSTILTWVDGGKTVPGRITITGDVRVHKKFHSNTLGDDRTLIVYLPPGYDAAKDTRYPVLYMHDGQNLFDASTSFAGIEWQVDENAQELITDGKIAPVIIVGIYNTPDRTDQFIGTKHALYGRFIAEEVKPFIDSEYRTIADRDHTALAGSAMGGLATIFIAQKHDDVFGTIALFDPFLRDPAGAPNGPLMVDQLLDSPFWATHVRWYVNMGSDPAGVYPGANPTADGRALDKALVAAGLKPGENLTYEDSPGAPNNEVGWSQRIGKLLTALYAKPAQ